MRVLYLSKALVVAEYRRKLRALERPGLEVTGVIPERWGAEPVEASGDGVPEPRRVPVLLDGHNHFHLYRRPAAWLDEIRPDLVHVDEEPYSLVTLQLARLCRRRDIPCVFFAWQNIEKRLPPPFGLVRSAVFRRVAGAIAGTDRAADVLRSAGYEGPLTVVAQFGVDTDRFRPDPGLRCRGRTRMGVPADAFLVGYGGRLVPEKGVRLLVEALARMEGRPPAHLVFVGDGEERPRLEEDARRAGLSDRVHFTGRLPSGAMPEALAALDALALPSVGTRTWREQFGRILVEAMACGVPVVGSACGEIPEVVGTAGDVVPLRDAAALASALARLRDDDALRARRSREGRERVQARYTHAAVAERTAAFYREVA